MSDLLLALEISRKNVYVYCNGREIDLDKTFYDNKVNNNVNIQIY